MREKLSKENFQLVNSGMIDSVIISKKEPFTKEEMAQVSLEFQTYIKTVVDISQKICSAGANRHFENEVELLKQGSEQTDLWGGGIDLETLMVDNNSIINIRPHDKNFSNEIQDPTRRTMFEDLMKYFFQILWKN